MMEIILELSDKELKDITGKSFKMARNTAILYNEKQLSVPDAAHFRGITVLKNGDSYWIFAWLREVKGEPVLEIKFKPR
jgi:hypothetical protein